MKSSLPIDLYYPLRDLSALLRFSEATLRRWVKAGRFSPGGDLSNILDVGGDVRVPRAGVAFFLESHPMAPPPPRPRGARFLVNTTLPVRASGRKGEEP